MRALLSELNFQALLQNLINNRQATDDGFHRKQDIFCDQILLKEALSLELIW